MRTILGLLLVSILFGCGGSSGSDDNSNTTANTAPVLTGQLSMQLTAASAGSVNFALLDAENDQLTVNYTNKPDWVEGTLSSNQLQLAATPDFFSVGAHQFGVRVSDGKLHSDYTITLNVADDPSKWVEISTPKVDFVGQWALDNGDSLHLYANETGRYLAADGDVFDLVWYGMNGYIEISSTQVNCVSDECYDYFEVYVIATEEGRKRLVLESDEEMLAVTVTPHNTKPLQDGLYSLNHLAVDYVYSIDGSSAHIYAPFKFMVSGSSLNSWAEIETQFTAGGGLQAKSNIDQFTMNLYRYTTGDYVNIEFGVNFVVGEILPSADGRLTIQYQLSFVLNDSTIEPQDFDGMTEALAQPYTGHLELGFNEQTAVPQFALDTSYYASFRLKPDFDNHNMLFGAAEVLFRSANKGIARFSVPQAFTQQESEFDWTIDGRQLVITLGDEVYRYRFIQHPANGLSIVNQNNLYSPLLVADQQYSAQALFGNFLTEQYVNMTPYYHNIFADNTASLFTSYRDVYGDGYKPYKWQQESDGSITFVYSAVCDEEQTFSQCATELEQRLEDGESVTVNYRNFKVIKQTERETFIQSSYDYRNSSYNQSVQSVLRLLNVPQ